MRTRDPEGKRQQLLEAALAEFAEFGIAGARVDRLARRAGISPGLVYAFYKGKEALFDAVFDHIVELVVSTVPIDADHLAEYAGMLYDGSVAHPEVVRFMTWHHLERGEIAQRAAVAESMRAKLDAITDAQQRGTVSDRIPAEQVLVLVLTIANMWHQPAEDLLRLMPEGLRREVIVDAVNHLVAP